MENIKGKILKWVAASIGSVTLVIMGVMFERYFSKADNALQHFEYYVAKSNNVMAGIHSDLKINNMEARDFSIVNIKVFNRTNKDYNNVPIKFIIQQDSPIVFALDVRDSRNVLLDNQAAGTMNEYQFKVTTANRNDEHPIIIANFVIKGVVAPDCIVDIEYQGLSTVARTELRKRFAEFKQRSWYLGIFLAISGWIIVFIFVKKNRELKDQTS